MGFLDMWSCPNTKCPHVGDGKKGDYCPVCGSEFKAFDVVAFGELTGMKKKSAIEKKDGLFETFKCPNINCSNQKMYYEKGICPECGNKLEEIGFRELGIKCSNCGHLNADTNTFCAECGKDLSLFTKKCPNCGTGNPETAKFCIKCSKPLMEGLTIFCPNCGTENTTEAQYCQECAYNLKQDVNSSTNIDKDSGLTAGQAIGIILLSPIAGFIGFLVWYGDKPKKAKQSAIIGFFMFIIIFLFITSLSF